MVEDIALVEETEASIMGEVEHLRREAETLGRLPSFTPQINLAQCLALRIAAQANLPLVPAGFLTESGGIQLILANQVTGRHVFLDFTAERPEAWAHLVSGQDDGETIELLEESSVAGVSSWLRG
jgi:hypothetical protein